MTRGQLLPRDAWASDRPAVRPQVPLEEGVRFSILFRWARQPRGGQSPTQQQQGRQGRHVQAPPLAPRCQPSRGTRRRVASERISPCISDPHSCTGSTALASEGSCEGAWRLTWARHLKVPKRCHFPVTLLPSLKTAPLLPFLPLSMSSWAALPSLPSAGRPSAGRPPAVPSWAPTPPRLPGVSGEWGPGEFSDRSSSGTSAARKHLSWVATRA